MTTESNQNGSAESQKSSTQKRGPKLLAWWTDDYGRQFQFLQDDDLYLIRHKQDGEWLTYGSWFDNAE